MYDSTSARKARTSSTGNAGRASYQGPAGAGNDQFLYPAGSPSPEAIIAGIDSGLYVHNVMGLHTVDTVSGDYSLGIMGERIEKGRRTHGVRGVTIAGNLLDLLQFGGSGGKRPHVFGIAGLADPVGAGRFGRRLRDVTGTEIG